MKKGFDNKKYVKIQSEKIKERFQLFDKLYLEVGGKLFDQPDLVVSQGGTG